MTSTGQADIIIPAENEDDHLESSNNGVNHHTTTVMEVSSEDELEVAEATEVGMTLEEFIEHVRVKGRRGLHEEYAEIKARAPSGTFNHARSLDNSAKNRYVVCTMLFVYLYL